MFFVFKTYKFSSIGSILYTLLFKSIDIFDFKLFLNYKLNKEDYSELF